MIVKPTAVAAIRAHAAGGTGVSDVIVLSGVIG
jgi:hypothetical protein